MSSKPALISLALLALFGLLLGGFGGVKLVQSLGERGRRMIDPQEIARAVSTFPFSTQSLGKPYLATASKNATLCLFENKDVGQQSLLFREMLLLSGGKAAGSQSDDSKESAGDLLLDIFSDNFIVGSAKDLNMGRLSTVKSRDSFAVGSARCRYKLVTIRGADDKDYEGFIGSMVGSKHRYILQTTVPAGKTVDLEALRRIFPENLE
ncbi:MAG: hypothetical protein J0M35_00425 [Candidatus Obscuribacter phosphatis]|uniref:Uncharacterized protein n=1 Tax=Candidatus Obscuribacter phosphatis TaxID=1906157 RepID=A0A8J7PCU8_9BACT|nr:hypothetical protein [Candidatus Obscuribacter phosphatis]